MVCVFCSLDILMDFYFLFARYLFIECEDQDVGVKQEKHIRDLYRSVMHRFLTVRKKIGKSKILNK